MKVKIIPFKTTVEGIFAELPEDVLLENIWFNEFYSHFLQFYLNGETFYDRVRLIEFDDAHYEVVNFARDMTDAECKRIVEGFFRHDNSENFDCWKNYHNPIAVTYGCDTPLKSFDTLMKSVKADSGKHWLVLVKKYEK
jgi:hypothetical protein